MQCIVVLSGIKLYYTSSIAQEKLAHTRGESQAIVILTSRITARVGLILISEAEHLWYYNS
jgi:hypothetical protein